MKRIYLEPYSLTSNLSIYTVRLEDEEKNETDKFLKYHLEAGYKSDIQTVAAWIRNLQKRGAREEYFRFEDRARAGPRVTSSLRLYCIRCHNNMIILDGGGLKKGRTAQDGEETKKGFELMNLIDKRLVEMIAEGEIWYSDDYMELSGNLIIEI